MLLIYFVNCNIIQNMRVVSGKYRGKVLKAPTSKHIRPTGDKVKQALFTKLQFFVDGAVVVDLFCGSGALGIEAISHGASFVYFVDKNKESLALTKKNLTGITEDYKVFNCDYSVALKTIDKKVDLFILDPPYASGVYEDALSLIKKYNLLNKDGIIVCEHPNELQIKSDFEEFDKKRYGTVTLTFLREKELGNE